MNSDWITKPLGEIITLQRGHDLPSQTRENGTIPILGSSGITGYHDQSKSKGPGVVIGRSGNSMGEVSYSSSDFWPLNTCLYVTDFKCNDELYIYYLLQTIDFDQFNSGSAQKSLNRNALYPFEIKITKNKDTQKKIGKVLRNLEDKIEHNRKTQQTLEQIAQAIFRSWFVDFEPTRSKIAAKETGATSAEIEQAAMCAISGKTAGELAQLSPETQQQLQATAALFPDAIVDSELGDIPDEWRFGVLSDIATYASERTYISEVEIQNYISTENMLVDKQGITASTSLPATATIPSFKKGHVLVSNIRPYFKKIWLANFNGGRSNDVLAFECTEYGNEEFLYNLLYQDSFFDFMMASSKGSKMPRGDKTSIMNFKLAISSPILRKLYSEKIRCFYNLTAILSIESNNLTKLRETLLPKLLSGELNLEEPNT